MKNRSTVITALIFIAIIALGIFWYQREQNYSSITSFEECVNAGYVIIETYPQGCKTPDNRLFVNTAQTQNSTTTPTPTPTGKENLIRVSNVTANQIITSPLTITGTARGTWYFEASFPVELIDGNGKQLAIKAAQAQGEWMTEDFVPFSVTLSFLQPTTATGTLILHKDNPSGDAIRDDSLRIPVRFSQAERQVKLYYYNSALDKDASGNILCSSKGLVSVVRTIKTSQTPLQDTLRLFLRGEITQAEKSQGVTSEFPLSGVALESAVIAPNGVTTITLLDPNNRTSGGSCRVSVLRAQIEATAKQFDTVKSVVFKPISIFQP